MSARPRLLRLHRRHRRRLAVLGPIEQLRAGRLPRRLAQLAVGLVLYGVTLAAVIRAGLGNAPWDVMHQGVADRLSLSIGTVVVLASLVVLVLWVPLRERPGLGTLANAVVVGVAADAGLGLIPAPHHLAEQVAVMAAGVLGNALATALYIGSQLGPGPRDGLMTGLHRVTGWPIGLVRAGLEVTLALVGFLLGGVLGIGTVVYAVAIGPLVQLLLPAFIVDLPGVSPPSALGGDQD